MWMHWLPDLNMTLYRLIQECLTNAVKHSRARKIHLRLALEENRVMLEVTESETTGNAAAVGASGTGLLGMRERVEAHGGELTLAFDPGAVTARLDAGACVTPTGSASCWWMITRWCVPATGAFSSRSPIARSSPRPLSGEEAYQLLQTIEPDIVILDLSMPGQGGLSVLRRMKLRWPLVAGARIQHA